MNSDFFGRVADFLEVNREKIAHEANERTYAEIQGYLKGGIPREESQAAILRLLNFIISNLRKHDDAPLQDDPQGDEFLRDLINFEEGIASRRVEFRIDLIDLLHGIRICRNKIWDYLRRCFIDESIESCFFFRLEKRINTLIVYFFIYVAKLYLEMRDQVIESQSSSLKKWEEVVKSTSHLDLKIPCKEEFAAIVRAQAEAIARRLNYNEEEVQDIVMTVGEACDNSIEHGCSEKGIDLHYMISKENLEIEVIDYGKGFDPEGMGLEVPDLFSERGRGIFIMKNLMDSVAITSRPGEGTYIKISKKRVFR
ncbi:MAG: ATP-binding protein [Candidatus Eremiobacteraeota bacterium]|nr:ATP-binding protein [Candidatus Eremiobacteraeota bacterium]